MARRATPLLLSVITSLSVAAYAPAQTVVPVYPGSTLNVDPADPTCCGFSTRDPLASVVAFYQARLKTPALAPEAAAQKSPELAGRLRAMAAQLPPGVQYRVFLLPDNQVFELLASPQGVTFSITEEQLGEPGAAYAHDFARQIAQAGGGEPGQAMDPTRQEYEQWTSLHPLADDDDADIPIYSGARVEGRDDRSSGCHESLLIAPDPVDQVVAFYAAKLGPGYVRNDLEPGAQFERSEFQVKVYGLGGEEASRDTLVVVTGPSTAVNRRIQIGNTGAMWLNLPHFDAEQRMVVMERISATTITFTREVPTQACVGREGAKFQVRAR